MMKPTKPTSKVQGVLLALAIVLLQSFSASEAKDPAPARSAPKVAIPLVVAKPQCSGLTVTGPSSVSRYSSATFQISNWSGQCVTWYYNGSYTNTTNGSFTLYFDQWTSGDKTVTAIVHTGCSPSGQVQACGIKNFTVY
jgi:hypothetical protein